MSDARMREAFKVDWPNLKMPSDVMGGEQADRHAFAIYKAGYLASLTQQPESEPLSFYDKMQEAFDAWEKENECKCVFEDFKAGYLAALTKQPESEPVFEIQHGPINDNDGHPKWASIESLGGWDEFNFAPGTKLYAGPPPVQQPESREPWPMEEQPDGTFIPVDPSEMQPSPRVPESNPVAVFESHLTRPIDGVRTGNFLGRMLDPYALEPGDKLYTKPQKSLQVPEGWRVVLEADDHEDRTGTVNISGPGVYHMEMPVRHSMFDFFAALVNAAPSTVEKQERQPEKVKSSDDDGTEHF